MRSFVILALFFLVLGSCSNDLAPKEVPAVEMKVTPSLERFPDSTHNRIRSFFETLSDQGKFSGAALFYRDGMIDSFALGIRGSDKNDSLRVHDQFQLASLSKPFTALAILKLVSEKRISLDDSVSTFLPCTPYHNVTVKQLLTHTSGIGYYAYVTDSLWGMPEYFMQNADLMTMFECEEIPNYFEPGRQFNYCNTNYVLLADIIEAETQIPFGVYIKNEVFDRLNMKDSEILDVFNKATQEYIVRGHFASGKCMEPSYLDGVYGDKGMYSSLGDLFEFYRQMDELTIVDAKLWSEARSTQIKSGRREAYGFGWRIKQLNDSDSLVYHNGWWRGFRSYFWTSKKHDKAVIILSNSLKGGYLKKEEVWNLF